MLVGRKDEIRTLERLYRSGNAEFVAVYGRRRVGKTFLIGETFKDRLTFMHTGLAPMESESDSLLNAQLDNFYTSLVRKSNDSMKRPQSWFEAFLRLEEYLEKSDDGTRQLVFFDELPWLDTPKSGFKKAFEAFWNSWGCHRDNLMVIVCGSANSWVQDNLINNHGGLYNRLTYIMKLSPFTLGECEEFLKSRNVKLSRYDITQCYMIFGGIPFYLRALDPELSLAQNIDKLFFRHNAPFHDEFERLFNSMFTNPEKEKSIVSFLYTQRSGYTRDEISKGTGIANGGGLTKYLNALIECDFIIKYVPFGANRKEEHYKLRDPFCMFYLHFRGRNSEYWEQNTNSQELSSWRGFAFENVCFNHIPQIKKALGISGVSTTESGWVKKEDGTAGMQIDLLLNRADNVINMCELKFYSDDFTLDKTYYRKLLSRTEELSQLVSRKMVIRTTLITTFGLADNEYSSVFTNVITLDDLFD